MIKAFQFAKVVHRLLVFAILLMALIMGGTGILMRYPSFTAKFSFINVGQMRYVHNKLSVVFAVLLLLMALTGLTMYIVPLLIRRRAAKKPAETPENRAPF